MDTDIQKVLDYTYSKWDLPECTIRQYLVHLARACWIKEESFGGKRPFGNSGWKTDVFTALVSGGFIDGSLDEDGFLEQADEEKGERLILMALDAIAPAPR